MENDNNIQEIEKLTKIYSKKSIWAFSIFFTSLAGGILMMQNLKNLEKPKEAKRVLKTAVIIVVVTIIMIAIYPENKTAIALISNIIGGMIFSEFYFKLYDLEESNFTKKNIWKPLLISICISCIALALIYNNFI